MTVPHSLRHLFPGRLQHQLAALFALLFTSSIALYTLYVAKEQTVRTEEYLTAQARALTVGLAASSEEALTTGEVWQLTPMLRQASEFPGLLSIDLADPTGILLSSIAHTVKGSVVEPPHGLAIHIPSSREIQLIRHLRAGPQHADLLEVWVPIGKDSSLGWVRAHFSLALAAEAKRQLYQDSLWLSVAVALIAIAAFVLFLRHPMQRLQQATRFATGLEAMRGDVLTVNAGVTDIDALIGALNRASQQLYTQQSALRQSELHFRTVVEGLSEIVFETDTQFKLTYLNPAWQDITQFAVSDSLGRSILEFAPATDHARIAKAFGALTDERLDTLREQFRYLAKDGSTRWLEAFARARRDDSGRFAGFIGAASDITARVQAETALKAQLRFGETLIDNVPNALYVKDAQGRYLTFNRAFERLFDIRRADWLGKTVFDLLDDAETARRQHANDISLLEGGTETSYELTLRNRHGVAIETLCHKSVFQGPDGQPAGLIGSLTDISTRKQVETQMLRAKEAAEATSRAKSDFLANISHEIRTPMNAILGMTQLALETPLSEEQREYLSVVHSSAEGLLSILNDVLDFSKIEAGQLNFEHLPFLVEECVASAVRTLSAHASDKQLQLDYAVAPEIPAALVGDPNRLRQILLNLLSNAIKFTERGEIHVAVEWLETHSGRVCLRFAVSDTGIGIAPAHQAEVFNAFAQADTSISRRYGGTGLGLTISSRLVQGMGGKMWLESAPGNGSTFYFTTSFDAASEEDTKRLLHPETHPAHAVQSGNAAGIALRLLLAEDNPVNQTLAKRLLTRLGHHVDVVDNGEAAVMATQRGQYDAVLMDVQMPHMSGLEATQHIREREAADGRAPIPIIAMTAHAMAEDRERCLAVGMNGYITKPVITEALVAELAAVATGVQQDAPLSAAPPKPPAQQAIAEPPLFDRAWMLDQIGGDESLMHEVARIFLGDSERLLANLQQDIAASDMAALQASAHAIKGAIGNFGASAAVATALALEHAAKARDHERAERHHAELARQVAALVEALREELDAQNETSA